MNQIWQSIGLKGVNYYSMAEPNGQNTYSERSHAGSPYYQAWFGTYIIDAKKQLFDFSNSSINSNKKNIIEKLLDIGVLDQNSWLYAMGDPKASTATQIIEQVNDIKTIDSFFIDGRKVPVIEFSMQSHSDLTDSVTRLSGAIGMPDKINWRSKLDPYHPVVIRGFYIYWYNPDDETLKIIYGAGCSYTTKDKTHIDTYPSIKESMLGMARQMSYSKK